jgi:hypothetical protein
MEFQTSLLVENFLITEQFIRVWVSLSLKVFIGTVKFYTERLIVIHVYR